MTPMIDAAYSILQASGKPLHYSEIVKQAIDKGMISSNGLTPGASLERKSSRMS